jgi:hypothetical protein
MIAALAALALPAAKINKSFQASDLAALPPAARLQSNPAVPTFCLATSRYRRSSALSRSLFPQ